MNLYNIYTAVNNPYVVAFAILFSFLSIGHIHDLYKYCKTKASFQFYSDELLSKISYDARRIISILIHFVFILLITFGSNYFIVGILGCDDIRVLPEGTYCYYVNATNEKNKTYILPAKIYKYDLLDYCVDNVYFSNGGYLYFGEGYTDTFNFGETQTYHDQNENEWEIELTNYKTSHKDVQETKAKYSDDDIFRLIMVLIHIYVIILNIYFWKKHYSQNNIF